MRKVILLFILVVACTKDPRDVEGIDPEFASQVQLFEKLHGSAISVPIGFKDLEPPRIGNCVVWSNGYKQIEIDRTYWSEADEQARIGLLFHELGHCILNRKHEERTQFYSGSGLYGDVPISLMYPINFYSEFYTELQDYYLTELFNPEKNNITYNKSSDCVTYVND